MPQAWLSRLLENGLEVSGPAASRWRSDVMKGTTMKAPTVIFMLALTAPLATAPAQAQPQPAAPAATPPATPATSAAAPASDKLKAEQLDQLVAPIALYPDPLLAEVFMASTYPLEVVEADRWVKANKQ